MSLIETKVIGHWTTQKWMSQVKRMNFRWLLQYLWQIKIKFKSRIDHGNHGIRFIHELQQPKDDILSVLSGGLVPSEILPAPTASHPLCRNFFNPFLAE